MKRLNSLNNFAQELSKMIEQYDVKLKALMEVSAKVLEKQAKGKIGHLQPSVGGFPRWKELEPITKWEKYLLGFVFNDDFNPLLRTGEMRDSIKGTVNYGIVKEIVLGSESEIMLIHEEGKGYVPPRPVLGPTMFQGITLFNDMLIVFAKSLLKNEPLKTESIATRSASQW